MKRQITVILFLTLLFATTFFPLVKADNTNLAPFPTDWFTDDPWGYQVPAYNVYHDTVITYGGAYTFRIEPESPNTAFDYWKIDVSVSDHVLIKCWIKTNGTYTEDWQGARINLDWYGSLGRIADGYQLVYDGYMSGSSYDGYVHWGTNWTQVVLDFTVPTYVEADGWNPNYAEGQQVTPTFFVPWCQIWVYPGYPESAYPAWFSNYELYVNPISIPTPTPPPDPTPTPAPSPTSTIFPHPENTPTPTPVTQAQAATNQVFTNMYVALGIVVVSTLIAGCFIIITALNTGNGNVKFGVGILLISIVEVVVGVIIVSAFQGSMGTIGISFLGLKGIT